MKVAETAVKVAILVSVGVFLIWFWPELSSLPTTGGLFDKLLLIAPVMAAIRISLIIVALGIVGLVVLTFWKQIGIIKISSSGIEFGKFDEISSKTLVELAASKARNQQLETEIEALKKENKILKNLTKVINPKQRGQKND